MERQEFVHLLHLEENSSRSVVARAHFPRQKHEPSTPRARSGQLGRGHHKGPPPSVERQGHRPRQGVLIQHI